jgi:hypothetical protein
MSAPSRTYRRTWATRTLSAVCAILFLGGAATVGSSSGWTPWFFTLAALALASLASLISAFADRYTLSETGIEYRNAVLARLGVRPRRVAWEDVVQVREPRRPRAGGGEPRAGPLFLTLRSGRRMVIDSLQDYDEVRRTVRLRCDPGPRAEPVSNRPACPPR